MAGETRAADMNILYVTYGLPYPPVSGARIRDLHLIQQLSQRHKIHLFSLLEDPTEAAYAAQLAAYCASVEMFPLDHQSLPDRIAVLKEHIVARRPLATFPFMNRAMMALIREVAVANSVDAIQVEHSFLAPYVEALSPGFRGVKVLSLHNLADRQYQRIAQLPLGLTRRFSFWLKARLMSQWEAVYASHFDCVITVSETDRRQLASANPKLHLAIIENGVDTRQCQPLPEAAENGLLFAGTMGYAPNVDAMLWFCNEILPRIQEAVPDFKVWIVGRSPSRAVQKLGKRQNVIVTGQVPDLAPYYRQANVVIVPLRAGGGTRLKILEAMAYGRPVVSTTVGCEGLAVCDGETILIADSAAAFAARVITLLRDKAGRERIARAARHLVEGRYDWSIIGGELLTLYESLATRRTGVRCAI
ncbi:MAG TPA: glycosyltransferase family 4 protein [Anaerolineae bacterium]